jgi:phage terminase small subunit
MRALLEQSPMILTPKQEAFAKAYIELNNGTEAYKAAYKPKSVLANVIAVKASIVLANEKVAERIKELRSVGAEKACMTLKSHLDDLERLRDAAEQRGQFAAAISAEIARGKAAGVHIEQTKVDVTHHDDNEDARAAALEARLAIKIAQAA